MAIASITIELSEEDRELLRLGTEAMRALIPLLRTAPFPPGYVPVVPTPNTPFGPNVVWCGTAEARTVTPEGTVTW